MRRDGVALSFIKGTHQRQLRQHAQVLDPYDTRFRSLAKTCWHGHNMRGQTGTWQTVASFGFAKCAPETIAGSS